MNRIALVVGDESGDGHGQTEECLIETEFTPKQLRTAYRQGVKRVGVDIERECEDWRADQLPKNVRQKLRAADPPKALRSALRYDEALDAELYVTLWLWIAQKGNPALKYKWVTSETVAVGGYGLFS